VEQTFNLFIQEGKKKKEGINKAGPLKPGRQKIKKRVGRVKPALLRRVPLDPRATGNIYGGGVEGEIERTAQSAWQKTSLVKIVARWG
jgi:hypothetical protein